MPIVSVTRLRLRSWRFLPLFALSAFRSGRQAARSAGYVQGRVLAEGGLTYWTMTAWEDGAALSAYVGSGPHREALAKLQRWCDEAAVARWSSEGDALPSWSEADDLLREHGRVSRVRHPSPRHSDLTHAPPKGGRSVSLGASLRSPAVEGQ